METINCPTCNTEINVKKALQHQVSEEVNDLYAAKDKDLMVFA